MFTARGEIHFTTPKCTHLRWLKEKKKNFPFFVRLFLLNHFLPVFAHTAESTALNICNYCNNCFGWSHNNSIGHDSKACGL